MATTRRKPTRDQYKVGWICALKEEVAAAMSMLDEVYESTPNDESDDNHYTFGRVETHNVVIACLPAGIYGLTSATTVAIQMRSSFTSIKIRLMVGIGGGVPTSGYDIRLGDVVVSQPQGHFGGVVQYDRGKKTAGGKFEGTGQLNRPPNQLLNALSTMKGNFEMAEFDLGKYFRENLKKHTHMLEKYDRPHDEKDELYQTSYDHKGKADQDCISCDRKELIIRPPRRLPKEVKFHYGTIASGNSLVKDGTERDRISQDLGGILCFETEAAGLMDNFACLVIRGVCDYADSHKNKKWQRYAAVTAALYAKQLLSIMPGSEQPTKQQYGLPTHEISPEFTRTPVQQRSLTPSQWNLGPVMPTGSTSPGQWNSVFRPPIEQQWSHPPSQLALELGQPIEHQSGLPPIQPHSGFVVPIDDYRSNSPYHQPSTPDASIFNQSAIGYNRSASQYRVPSSDQLREGFSRPSAYPNLAIGQRSLEGVPSTQTLMRPSLAPNRIGHSESDVAKFRGINEPSGGIHKSAATKSQSEGSKGYTQQRDMVYPQFPKPSHPDRARQRSHAQGHSTPPIPLLPLPQSHSESSHLKSQGTPYTTGRGHQSNAIRPSGSEASRSFNTSHHGQSNTTAPYQGPTKYSGKGQPERSHVQALQAPEKDRKMPSHTKDPKPAAKDHKENSQGLTRKPLAQSHEQHGHSKEPKPSAKGNKEQSHHDKPRPSQKSSAPQDHAKPPKSSKGDKQEPNHHHDPNPSSKYSPYKGAAKEPKSPAKQDKELAHPDNEATHPTYGSFTFVYNNEAPPSATKHLSINEPNESDSDTETINSSRTSIDPELNHTPSDVEDDQAYDTPNAQVNYPYSQKNPVYGQQFPPYGQGYPPYEEEHSPYRQEPSPYRQEPSPYRQEPSPYRQEPSPYRQEPSPYRQEPSPYRQEPIPAGPGNPYFDQNLSAYPTYPNVDNDTGPRFDGEAAEYFSAASMGENEYLANQATNAIPEDQVTTSDHQTDDERGLGEDESSSYPKSDGGHYEDFAYTDQTQNTRGVDDEEEEADYSCGCCGGGDKGSDDGSWWAWLGCGGGSNDDDNDGCCAGMWNCCGDGERSDDGENIDDGEKST